MQTRGFNEMKIIAFFDFDGTISDRDSMIDFIRFTFGDRRFLIGVFRLLGVIVGYALRLVSDVNAKRRVMTYFFGGRCRDELQNFADRYAADRINDIIRPKGLEKIKWHLAEGHEVAIVSASIEIWLKKWSEDLGLRLIATKPEIVDNRFTGDLASPNCKGEEKIRRIREIYDLSEFERVYAYGDSPADRPMLSLATYSFYKPFRKTFS
ncbi:MAG: HAD-IB family hydrolase [Helicobacteraceae bacterium]|jgi:HAD superfamily hydrolase (TIGR01490 family)|nr:HAD-IB family hydrolase [Helicobacteraceae bacterium]